MPLPRWLRSLIQPKPTQTNVPPPPRGEGWGGGLAQNDSILQPPPTPDPSPQGGGEAPATIDNSHRIHIAANDPAFPAKREAAITAILAAINTCVLASGFTAKPQSWAKSGPQGTVSMRLKRDTYGWDCTISFGFQPIFGTATGIWADEDEVQLAHFYNEGEGTTAGVITYLDVHENQGCLDMPMTILKTRALPWLDAHLTAPIPPPIESYLSR